jgi:hypothetical protein
MKNQDHKLLMLKPEAQVIYVSAHLMFQHGGYGAPLRWFYDLDRLIRLYSERLDWNLLVSQARKFEWGSALGAALSKTVACFDTPVPEPVLTGLIGIFDRNHEYVRLNQVRLATHWLEERRKLLSLTWKGRILVVGGLIAPSPDYMRWRYGLRSSSQLPKYYLLRWWEILKDALRTFFLTGRK